MNKKLTFFLVIISVFFISCRPNIVPEKDYYEITIDNNTNLFIKYSIIEGYSSATTSRDFYAQSHTYLTDKYMGAIAQQLLSPEGHVSEGYELDKATFWVNKGKYNCTIFVCKSNNYTGKEDQYINKKQFYLTGDMTLTIGADGQIY